jgi:hypothetical protein
MVRSASTSARRTWRPTDTQQGAADANARASASQRQARSTPSSAASGWKSDFEKQVILECKRQKTELQRNAHGALTKAESTAGRRRRGNPFGMLRAPRPTLNPKIGLLFITTLGVHPHRCVMKRNPQAMKTCKGQWR